jgi:hypothetical protein
MCSLQEEVKNTPHINTHKTVSKEFHVTNIVLRRGEEDEGDPLRG